MPYQDVFPFMYLTYLVAGTSVLLFVSAVLVWLFLAPIRPGTPSRELAGQEIIWTLVPALVLLGLTLVGEIPRGWVQSAGHPGGAQVLDRSE